MTPMFPIREPSIAAIREAPVYLRYGNRRGRVLVDGYTGKAIMVCYEAMKPHNQAKIERMIASPAGLQRVVDFCWRMVNVA